MRSKSILLGLLLGLITTALPSFAVQEVHAAAGILTKVDSAAKTFVVKTADGAEQVFKFTSKTTVQAAKGVAKGAKTGALDTYMAGKEGTHVIVHYIGKGADHTAVAVKDLGKDELKLDKGTVTRVDKDGHTLAIKTEDGTEHTYHIAKNATIDTEHGVVRASEHTAKTGDKVVVHYTEIAGHKVAQLIKHI